MRKLIWKLRFSWCLYTRGGLAFHLAWGIAEDAYINTSEGPIDAAFEELGYWGEQ